MNTNALLSLDELVNQPERVLKRLEKYGELVLIRDNRPYCVVSRVEATEEPEEEFEAQEVEAGAKTEPETAPLAADFASESASPERTEGIPELQISVKEPVFSSAVNSDGWFWNSSYGQDFAAERDSVPDFHRENEEKNVSELEIPSAAGDSSVFEEGEVTGSFAPSDGDFEAEAETGDEPIAEGKGERAAETAPYEPDYIPYEVLKAQHTNLWDAMAAVLKMNPKRTMHAVDIARIINERGLYQTRDGRPVTAVQVRARVGHRPDRFEALGGNMIRLLHS